MMYDRAVQRRDGAVVASGAKRELGAYDVAVIGGGVVGCAVLRALTLAGLSTCLLERGPDILSGAASKGNSAILHTGFDAPESSLEHRLVRAGYQAYLEIHRRLNLPVLETGAVVVAWTDEQAAKLDGIAGKAARNGVDVEVVTAKEVYRREPHLAAGVCGGVLVPGEHVIDPWSAPLAYAQQAIANGASVFFDSEVTGAEQGGEWVLQTLGGAVRADTVINCAGLFGDFVDDLAGVGEFTIAPRKGQFLILDKSAFRLVRSVVLPVPTERTKGVLIVPTVFGNLLVGPTAEDVNEREHPTVDHDALRSLLEEAAMKVPGVRDHDVTAVFAGLRPATEHRDYQITANADRRWVTVGGIRSTGLSASLGIGEYVLACLRDIGHDLHPLTAAEWPVVPNLAEHLVRPYQEPNSGEIVCHCELVTRGEIERALSGPMPARSLGALKRRTRVLMGRCQGFFCTAAVASLTERHLHPGIVAPRGDE